MSISLLQSAPVLPVIRIDRLADALPLARALVEGGLPVLELTLRTPVAMEALRAIVAGLPQARVGVGTVLRASQIEEAAAAGAAFAISPGATESLYRAAAQAPIPWIPAVASASELMLGIEHGHRAFKFFPAESSGGIQALRAFAGPFPEARFCPTGGIDAGKAAAYLALPNVLTVGGSWMLPQSAIDAGDWAAITHRARAAAQLGHTVG